MKTIALTTVLILFASCQMVMAASGGTLSGTVYSNGAPLRAAFVRIHNDEKHINIHVLSDGQGHYRVENVLPGTYQVLVSSFGYDGETKSSVTVADGQSVSVDLKAGKRLLRWDELSTYQGIQLLPETPAKKDVTGGCFSCHKFQAMMIGEHLDEAGFRSAVRLMRDVNHGMGWIIPYITDDRAADIVTYLTANFGPDSKLPPPETLAQYQTVKAPEITDQALGMGLTYVDFEVADRRFPFSGAPDGKGSVWIPYYGIANRIGRLDLETYKVQEIKVPSTTSALIHSAIAAPDGTVWFSEQNNARIGVYDPRSGNVTEYQQPPFQSAQRPQAAQGSKHTVRPSADNRYVWASGEPLTLFDRGTQKFSPIAEVPNSYGIDLDKEGNAWFTEMIPGGKIGKVDRKTLKVTKFAPPTPNAFPRRIFVAQDGMIWFAEFRAGKLTRFDPETQTFKEFALPGPAPDRVDPYGIAVDHEGFVWYMSELHQILGRLDPKTGKVVQFPTPYSEGFGRELFVDREGHIWYGLFSRNRVGYFTLDKAQRQVSQSR